MAALYFEQAQTDFEKGKNGFGLVRLAASWRGPRRRGPGLEAHRLGRDLRIGAIHPQPPDGSRRGRDCQKGRPQPRRAHGADRVQRLERA